MERQGPRVVEEAGGNEEGKLDTEAHALWDRGDAGASAAEKQEGEVDVTSTGDDRVIMGDKPEAHRCQLF